MTTTANPRTELIADLEQIGVPITDPMRDAVDGLHEDMLREASEWADAVWRKSNNPDLDVQIPPPGWLEPFLPESFVLDPVSASRGEPSPLETDHQPEDVAAKLDELNRWRDRLYELEMEESSALAEWDACKRDASEAKKRYEAAVARTRAAIRRRADPQRELPFGGDGSENGTGGPSADSDEWTAYRIDILAQYGLTEAKCEALVEQELPTIGDLEALMRADEHWHRKLKGFGETWIDKLTDALLAFRRDHPHAEADQDGEVDF